MVAQSAESIVFTFVPDREVVVQRHHGQVSGDAGLLPVRQFDEGWGYTRRMAACLGETGPDPARRHSLESMLRQRVYGILAGYEDCNDHDALRDDPVFKLLAGRLPDGDPLASQPTLSRFENAVTPAALQALIDFTVATGVQRLKESNGGEVPAVVVLDLDATDDPAHGEQQLTLFHGYYGQYQYFPLVLSEPTTRHVFLAWLRPGAVHAALGAEDDLMRVVHALRKERPDVVIHVRADAGFGVPWMYEVCEKNGLLYTFGFSSNPRLQRLTEGLMRGAAERFAATGEKARLFECLRYQCDTWPAARTVVAKAECHAAGTNLRFLVTNVPASCPLPRGPAAAAGPAPETAGQGEAVYDDYVRRGESEQRMDELKNGLGMGRLSCHRFLANFFRLLLHVAAYNLLNAVRDRPGMPEDLRRGQPCTWRTRVIKVAAEAVQSTRRVVVRLAAQWPWWPCYQAASARSAAFTPLAPSFTPSPAPSS